MRLNKLLEVLDDDVKVVIVKDDDIVETTKLKVDIKFMSDIVVYVRQDYAYEQIIIKIKGE